jgi:DNA-binding winged helix-turn-helix (wHTH) protein/TolB-like protein
MAFTPQELQAGFRIGEALVEPRQNRIVRGESEVRLEPRVMDVLVCLAQRAGDVVSRETLNSQVWGTIVVTDQAVTNCISELRHHLGDDRTHRIIETIPKRGYRLTAPVQPIPAAAPREEALQSGAKPAASGKRWISHAGLLLLGVVLVGLAWWWQNTSASALTSIAVLRFENAGDDGKLDYLALALPDEIATLLTPSRNLAVRPLDYVDAADPLRSAKSRGVDHIVSGRYYLEDDNELSLAIEAQEVDQERVIWRTRITAPSDDLLAMRRLIAESVQHGLLPALGTSTASASGAMPSNGEAYQLYLRSLALPKQPNPTARAVEMLERVVALEPGFARAWFALGVRYYDYGTYGAGGVAARQRSLAAHRKALELDPELISAAREIVTHLAESGDLEGAFVESRRLLDRFGAHAETRFASSYVLRYGGLLEDSQHECELALQLDPQDPRLRSCAYAYLYAGELARVTDWLALDEGSYFVQWATVLYYLRLDDRNAALRITRQAADDDTKRLMEPCLEGASDAALDAPVAAFVRRWASAGDPEAYYAVAPMLLYCGRKEEALRLLERAVDARFCSFPAVDLDPVWKGLRPDPEFQRIRTKAMACHDGFRKAVAALSQPA